MSGVLFERCPVIVRGGGDLASGVIYKLVRAGFSVGVTELVAPMLVRRAASYGEAVYSGHITVEGITAVRADLMTADEAVVRVYTDYDLPRIQSELQPVVIVDARMDKINHDTRIDDAPLVIALGPGYSAGVDCHAVIETKRGHTLGKVIESGATEPDTGEPDAVQGITYARVLRAPQDGHVIPELTIVSGQKRLIQIGDMLEEGQPLARINGEIIHAPFRGMLRGLIHQNVQVRQGMKIGDIDPRGNRAACFSISDKARAIGGGVLEAILAAPTVRVYLRP